MAEYIIYTLWSTLWWRIHIIGRNIYQSKVYAMAMEPETFDYITYGFKLCRWVDRYIYADGHIIMVEIIIIQSFEHMG